jgi:hypothetical protein
VAFDEDNFYLAFRCWDTHPERRVATEMRRDGQAIYSGNDVINFFLDTFYDRRNGFTMTINSIGGRSEGQVTAGQYNADWNPIWDYATSTFEGGWTIEVALPFKSMRYRPEGIRSGDSTRFAPFAGETRSRRSWRYRRGAG